MDSTPKVALLVETARGYGRQLLRGIIRYARLHGPWGFYVSPGDFLQGVPQMRHWGGTGIIARVETPAVARALWAARLPTIALDLSEAQLRSPRLAAWSEVASDSASAARLAAEHLLERQFRHYAFVGQPGRVWSQRREGAFVERIRQAGLEPRVYRLPRPAQRLPWGRQQAHLAEWLTALPKPVGLLACNDDRGREVLEACRAAGVPVPEQVAVIGVDNDELLCELADPPLSSVALNAEGGGYRLAELLDRMMRGEAIAPQRLIVEPLHVVTRRSTDIMALDDVEVAAALRFIHHQAGRPLRIEDIVDHVQLSRRALEIRFQRALGRTIHSEVQRARLERARRLLEETDLPIPKVAEAAGYGSPSYLIQVFREELGLTPAKYRVAVRTGGGIASRAR